MTDDWGAMPGEWDYEAEIEDTCRCQNCGFVFLLGGNDHVIVEVPGSGIHTYDCDERQAKGESCSCGKRAFVNQIVLCMGCAKAVHDAYREALRDASVCEHGVNDGDYCAPCNAEYKRARKEHGDV